MLQTISLRRLFGPARRGVLTLITAFVLLLPIGGDRAAIQAADEPATTVSLTVDYGDGAQKMFTALPWREGLTVLDAVRAAEKHARGIKCEVRGAGETAFLVKIDDMKNEGGGGRGWMFRVNGKLGDRGLGVYPLKAGDAVLWKFEKYR